MPKRWSWLLLLTSAGTLLCCALPILMLSLGFGAAAAALYSGLPFLASAGHYTVWINTGSALLLIIAGWVLYKLGRACPADPALAAACKTARKWNLVFFWLAAALWVFGVFFEAFFIRFFR